jgi:Flp pilus assembly protein TadG
MSVFFIQLRDRVFNFAARWGRCEEGLAALEAAYIFPVLLVLLLGTFDLGNGILASQKAIRASQVTADLVTRNIVARSSDIDEAIEAGRLALSPFPTDSYGVDIISIRFDSAARASIAWRETRNMASSDGILQRVESLAEPNGGIMVVVVEYLFEPAFAGFVVGEIPIQEVAFSRGRKSAVVSRE